MTETIKINKIIQPIVSIYDGLNTEIGLSFRNKLVQWMNNRSMNDY